MSKQYLSKGQARVGFGANLLFVAIGVASIWYGTYVVQKVEDAKQSWSNVDGVIIQSGLRSRRQRHDRSWTLDVRYKYSVDGSEFTCDKVGVWNFGGSGGGENKAREVAQRYKMGDVVQVFYNPDKPSDAMLDPDLITFWWLHCPHIFGLVFLLGGMFRVMQYAPVAFKTESPFQG